MANTRNVKFSTNEDTRQLTHYPIMLDESFLLKRWRI